MLPTFDTILYCTKLGPNAAYTLRYAYSLAEKLSSRLIVLHVLERLDAHQEAVVEAFAGEGALQSAMEQEERSAPVHRRKQIEELCAEVAGGTSWQGVVDRILVGEGHVQEEILRHISALDAGLVVMGAHSESSLLEALLGTTAEKVSRRSHVPVMLIQVPEGKQDQRRKGK